jgi:hypothetical protein
MDVLAVFACPLLPSGYRSFIQSIGMDNGLNGTSIGQQGDHDDDQFGWGAQSFHHRASSCAKSLVTRAAAIALRLIRVNPNVARSSLASCGTHLVGAKLFRCVHRLCCVGLHTHIMPMDSAFFKLSPPFSPVSAAVPGQGDKIK